MTVEVHLDQGELAASLRADVRRGLGSRPYSLPPKWFYDAAGSVLFDQITTLPEYYPTKAERAALTAHADDIARRTRADTVMELGSGSS
ncbi:MAG: L-histidine N(alpha)-methyltransferase, partial [Actinomycetes bacterium]